MINVFSISKLFTSLVVMQLVDEGLVDLDHKVSDYLSWVPCDGTVRHFLSHSAGVPNPIWGSFYIHWADAHRDFDRDAFLREIVKDNAEAEFAPGESVLYTNLGYAILGAVIEERTGISYELAVAERVFQALALHSASFDPARVPDLSSSYVTRSPVTRFMMKAVMEGLTFERAGRFNSIPSDYYFDFPAHGGLVVAPKDTAAFLTAIVSTDPRILSEAGWERWFTPQDVADRKYALGWRVEETVNGLVLTHAGGAMGHSAMIRFYVDEGIATYFQSNILDSMRIERRYMNRVDSHARNLVARPPVEHTGPV